MLKCDRCGRQTRTQPAQGQSCGMPQPSGEACGGNFIKLPPLLDAYEVAMSCIWEMMRTPMRAPARAVYLVEAHLQMQILFETVKEEVRLARLQLHAEDDERATIILDALAASLGLN